MSAISSLIKHPVFKNFSYLTIGNILSQLLGVVVIYKLTRIFAPDDYGVFTFMVVQGQLIMTLGDLGIRNIIIRTVSRNPNQTNQLFQTGLTIKVFSILIFSSAYFFYNHFWGTLSFYQVLLVCFFGLISSSSNLLESLFYGLQKMLLPSISNMVYNCIWLIIVLIWTIDNPSINQLFNVFIFVSFIKTILLFIFLIRRNHLVFHLYSFNKLPIFSILKESLPYYFLALMMLPISYLSNNFLVINSSSTELGYFNLSNKILAPVAMVFTYSFSAIFPNLSNLWSIDKNKFLKLVSSGIYIFIVGASIFVMLFSFLLKDLIQTFFSKEYYPSIPIFQVQIWYVLLMGVNSLIGTIWGASNNEKLLLKASLINFLISTPALWYGSKYGAFGLSLGYLVSFTIFEIYLFYHFLKSMKISSKNMNIPWLFTIVLFTISWIFKDSSFFLRFIVIISISILVYSFRKFFIPVEIRNKFKKKS